MILQRRTKLPVVAAVLLSASLAVGATQVEKHPAPHHKPHKATHPPATHPPVTHHSSPHPTTKHASAHRSSKKSRKRPRGQQAIDNSRVREIQQALVRKHYLTGEPSGTWDPTTQAAMRRYQAEQGWQTKTVPDARALIRLGLGPDHEHLLNPESAMTTEAGPGPEPHARAASAARAASKVPAQGPTPVSVPASMGPAGSAQ